MYVFYIIVCMCSYSVCTYVLLYSVFPSVRKEQLCRLTGGLTYIINQPINQSINSICVEYTLQVSTHMIGCKLDSHT